MAFKFEIDIKYTDVYSSGDEEDDEDYEQSSKKLEINFKFGLESTLIFIVNKLDKKTFKKIVKVLKNTPTFETEDSNEDIILLLKSGKSIYNKKTKQFIFRLDNSRNYHAIIYNTITQQIFFLIDDAQCCPICDCGDCDYYSEFAPSLDIKIPFNDNTKTVILKLFTDIIDIIDK